MALVLKFNILTPLRRNKFLLISIATIFESNVQLDQEKGNNWKLCTYFVKHVLRNEGFDRDSLVTRAMRRNGDRCVSAAKELRSPPVKKQSGNDPRVFGAFNRSARNEPCLTEHHRNNRCQNCRRVGRKISAPIIYGIMQAGACVPSG